MLVAARRWRERKVWSLSVVHAAFVAWHRGANVGMRCKPAKMAKRHRVCDLARAKREQAMVSKAIKAAIRQIAIYDPALADTLTAEIKSGKVFAHGPKAES